MKLNNRAIIFDIDGTLANIDHRRFLLEAKPVNWDAFFDEMILDAPILPIVNLYQSLHRTGEYRLVLATGRPNRYRRQTVGWLNEQDSSFHELLMRADDDRRPDHVIKKEFLRQLQGSGLCIEAVFDDRQSVVDMWRDNGIVCLQCAQNGD